MSRFQFARDTYFEGKFQRRYTNDVFIRKMTCTQIISSGFKRPLNLPTDPSFQIPKDLPNVEDPRKGAFCAVPCPKSSIIAISSAGRILFYDSDRQIFLPTELDCHSDVISAMKWLEKPEGNGNLVTGSLDKTLKIFKSHKMTSVIKALDWVKDLDVYKDEESLLYGCINSQIELIDMHTLQVVFTNKYKALNSNPRIMNSVNSIAASPFVSGNFASGLRDGSVHFYDAFAQTSSIFSFTPHEKQKINMVKYSEINQNHVITSGRNSKIALWDRRKISDLKPEPIMTYSGHLCAKYHIPFTFLGENEEFLATGSEDAKCFIFSSRTGKILKTLPECGAVHIVSSCPTFSKQYQLITSSITAEGNLSIWEPFFNNDIKEIALEAEPLGEEMKIFENVMSTNGDEIMRAFHDANISYSGIANGGLGIDPTNPDFPNNFMALMRIFQIVSRATEQQQQQQSPHPNTTNFQPPRSGQQEDDENEDDEDYEDDETF